MSKSRVIAVLEEAAAALEILDDGGFRKMAWRNAARALDDFAGDYDNLLALHKLTQIKGIGDGLARMIETIEQTGSHPEIDQVKAKLPPGLLEILKVDGIGPKKLQQLWMLHGIQNFAQLKAAAEKGQLSKMKGFGAKTSDKIQASILFVEQQRGKLLITDGRALAAKLIDSIHEVDAELQVEWAGQLARHCEIVDCIELRVCGDDVEGLEEAVLGAINPSGDCQFENGALRFALEHTPVRIDLLPPPDQAGPSGPGSVVWRIAQDSAPEHFAELRRRAAQKQWTLSHESLLDAAGKPLAPADPAAFYALLNLPAIPAPLRENIHEFALADGPGIPLPLAFADLQGCVHNHTTESDGRQSLPEMVAAARALGLTYFGVADHSQAAAYARGLSPDRLLRQTEEVDGLNRRLKLEGVDCLVLKGTESDILEDGALDYEDWVLDRLDYVVASVHSRFGLDQAAQTKRLVRALEHPKTCILGHMTGRLLLERAGYALDRAAIFQAAAAHQVAIEFNCHPQRLDVDWRYMQEFKALGGKFILSADAHSAQDLQYLKLGVDVIQKAGLAPADILNTLSGPDLLAYFRARGRK